MELKSRIVRLNLTDDEVARLSKKAAVCGLTVSEVLESFISDLTCGDNAHGVNEKFYAGSWFVAWRSNTQPNMTFLRYLMEHGYIKNVLNAMNGVGQGEDYLQTYSTDYLQEHPEKKDAFESEKKRVLDWCSENRTLMLAAQH